MKPIIHRCLECDRPIHAGVYEFSKLVFGHALCVTHQAFISDLDASPLTVDLYFSLKSRDIPVALAYVQGDMHIDIALPGKLHIEVHGSDHDSPMQAIKDLTKSIYSLSKNVPTILVPEYLLDNPQTFKLAVDELASACESLLEKSSSYHLAHSLTAAQLQ